ncbi:unnamed protein product [Rotaria magnacalcarata]
MNLKDACPNDLKLVNIDDLKPITIIEASRLYSRGSTTGRTCNCRGNCAMKTCPLNLQATQYKDFLSSEKTGGKPRLEFNTIKTNKIEPKNSIKTITFYQHDRT